MKMTVCMCRWRRLSRRWPRVGARVATRAAFTLLEVLLTLAMSVVLMVLIGSTLQFYATNMNVRDTDVRRVHLASSILQMVSDDLRASLYGSTFDASTLESFLASAVQTQAASAVAAVDPAAADVLGLGAEEPTLTDASLDTTTDLVASTLTLTKPGMIGNQSQIQFDISRLPRMEQWAPTISSTPGVLADVPSDVKTVTYYVQAPGTIAGVADPLQGYLPASSANPSMVGGGLVRRELDRAASKWATDSGGLTGLMMTGELIATEVVSIGFEYFDGTIWQIMWNSDDNQAMPKAIRITLTVADETATSNVETLTTGIAAGTRTFTHIVQLPVGMMVAPAADPAVAETTGTSETDAPLPPTGGI
jgi:hypothetical protein